MSKNVTITVPDQLYARMQTHKEKMNISKVCQDALDEKIQAFERRYKLSKGEEDMEAIIERLKKEKEKEEDEWYEQGWKDGAEMAPSLPYGELRYLACTAETVRGMCERVGGMIGCDPTKGEDFGEYFAEMMEQYGFGWEETYHGEALPDESFQSWEQGLVDAVRKFWEKVRDKL